MRTTLFIQHPSGYGASSHAWFSFLDSVCRLIVDGDQAMLNEVG